MFSQQCLEVLYHTATNLPNRLFSSDFVLGNMVETEVRVFKLFPLQPGTQQCSLPGILPVCLCVHTSILARQLPGWGCWKQVNLPRLASLWALVCEACINFESPLYRPHSDPSIPSCDNLLTGHLHAICVGFGYVMPVLLQNRLPERQTPLRVTAGHHANRVRQNHHAERVSFCQLDSLRYSRNYGFWALRQRRNVPRGITFTAAGKLREIRNIHVLWEYSSQ